MPGATLTALSLVNDYSDTKRLLFRARRLTWAAPRPGLPSMSSPARAYVIVHPLLKHLSNLVQDRMPFIGPEKGALLRQIIRERQPRQVVEVGSMAGYSALTMAQALGPDGQVISLESDWKWALAAKRFVWQATQGDKSSKPVRSASD